MDGTTAWYASQTFWGAIAAVGAGAGAAYASYRAGDYGAAGAGLTAMFGGLMAVVGRFKAAKPLGVKTTPSVAEKIATKAGVNVSDAAVSKAATQVATEAIMKK